MPEPAPEPMPEPAPAPSPQPPPKDISNVVFYLTDGDSLVAIKLNYSSSLDINNYLQPASLSPQVAALVNADPVLEGYSVVGYSIKAGLGIHTFGTTYTDLIQNTGGNPALASGTYDGTIHVSATAIAGLDPIELASPATALSANDVLDTSLVGDGTTDPSLGSGQKSAHDKSDAQDTGDGHGGGTVVSDHAGDDVLSGHEGADVFKWTLAEPGAHDTVSNFSMKPAAAGGDVLDLKDLLPPESVGNLDSYLHFEHSPDGGTVLKISPSGEFTGNAAHDAQVAYQSIELQNVDLLSLGSDQQIIDNLLKHGKLITE